MSEEEYIAAKLRGCQADGIIGGTGDAVPPFIHEAVMIGRPFSAATVGGLEEGVNKYIDQMRTELVSAMVLTSVTTASAELLR